MAATDEECQNQSRFHQFCSTIWVETSSCPCTGHYLELLIKWNLMSRETVKTTGEDYRFSVSRAVHPSIHSQEFNSSQKKKASKSKKEQHPKVSQVQLSMFLLQTIPEMNPLRKQERQTGELLTKWQVFWDVLLLAFVFSYRSPTLRLSQSLPPKTSYVNSNLLTITADTLQMLLWIMLLNQLKCVIFVLYLHTLRDFIAK